MNKQDLKTRSEIFTTSEYKKQYGNVIINRYIDRIEIVQYFDPFEVFYGERSDKGIIDRSRLFAKGEDGLWVPLRNDIDILRVQDSVNKSTKRSCEMFYGYAYSNVWQYFATFTTSPEFVDRNNDEDVKILWHKFTNKLRKLKGLNDIKYLCNPERHEPKPMYPKGALHFHCLFGNVDLSKYMHPFMKNGRWVRSKNGSKLYLFDLWDFGFATICNVPHNTNDQFGVIRYLAKYMKKASTQIGYNKKRYFASRNLDFKNKQLYYFDDDDINKLDCFIDSTCGDLVKVTDKAKYYEIKLEDLESLGLTENDILG